MARLEKQESLKIVPPDKKKCVWMEAGVVSYKLCDNNYDCPTCAYDHAMQAKVEREREKTSLQVVAVQEQTDQFPATWRERMLTLPASQRRCRYMLTGHVANKICPNSYECGNCSYDQMMQERLEAAVFSAQKVKEIGGVKVVDGYYYHEGHTWARPEHGGRVRVGVDDFARRLLGSLNGISLPEVGDEVRQGEASVSITRDGESVSLLSPVDGVVTYVNYEVLSNRALVSEQNYEGGWLFIVEPAKLKANLKKLMFGEEAESFIMAERDRLVEEAGSEMRLAADGALIMEDIAAELKGEAWSKVVRKFLRS
jgi:glycine cleavage system H lipoate-binding protein